MELQQNVMGILFVVVFVISLFSFIFIVTCSGVGIGTRIRIDFSTMTLRDGKKIVDYLKKVHRNVSIKQNIAAYK